jgi:IS30 family transposase
MVTLVERPSRFAVLIKVPSKNTAVVVAALSGHVRKLPATLRRSLTWGRRLEEMARHKTFTVATDVKVYLCDPQRPWQRGITKHQPAATVIFLRGTDLSVYSQAQLDRVPLRLNQRPRETLGFQTPAS